MPRHMTKPALQVIDPAAPELEAATGGQQEVHPLIGRSVRAFPFGRQWAYTVRGPGGTHSQGVPWGGTIDLSSGNAVVTWRAPAGSPERRMELRAGDYDMNWWRVR